MSIVHPNPGPLSDLLQIIAEKNHTPAFNIPHINTFPHQNFDFESFFIDPAARTIVKERCFNVIYSCSAHPNLNDCFAIFTKFYVKHSVALSNIVTTTITECLLGYRCAYCLKASNKHKGTFLPDGYVCSPTCESEYMDKFILPFNHSEHRCRAKWVQHLGLRSMNNFDRLPSCKDHFSFRICLLDTINLETIKNWASAPENTEKARKKRSQRRSVPKISPDHLINYIYNLAGGTICAGHSCSQTLWLYTGPSEFDIRTDLQYCNLACLNSRNNLTRDLHVDRISIITLLSPRNILPL